MWALEYRAEKDGSNTLPSDMSVLPPWVRDALAGSSLLTKYRKNDHLNYIHTLYLAIRAPAECDVEAGDFSEQLEKYIAKIYSTNEETVRTHFSSVPTSLSVR